jgi:MSHA biogenesis protein MshL
VKCVTPSGIGKGLGLALGAGVLAAVLSAQTPVGQAPRASQMPTLPLTQLDERALAADLDSRAFTFTFAQPVAVRDLLLLLVRGTNLSMLPDPAIGGTFIGELKDVTVRQALGLVLPPLGLDYAVDGPFVRVFHREPETRLFAINYIATERSSSSSVGAAHDAGDTRVTSVTSADMFAELAKGVQTLLSEHATFNLDRKAGLLQVTDFPERLDRVATYLDAVHDRVHRQVEIDARVLEVELNDPAADTLDLASLIPGKSPPNGGAGARLMLSGLRAADVEPFLAGLATVGKVSLLADPHLLALNNETAIVRATMTTGESGAEGAQGEEEVTLAVTPQIASESAIMLSLSPVVTVRAARMGKAAAPAAVQATDTLARLASGETLILGGFSREREIRQKSTGLKGGWFGRSTTVTRKRVELLILLTPTILGGLEAQ